MYAHAIPSAISHIILTKYSYSAIESKIVTNAYSANTENTQPESSNVMK